MVGLYSKLEYVSIFLLPPYLNDALIFCLHCSASVLPKLLQVNGRS